MLPEQAAHADFFSGVMVELRHKVKKIRTDGTTKANQLNVAELLSLVGNKARVAYLRNMKELLRKVPR